MAILQQDQAGTTLSETITANAFWTNLYKWTISKSVSPEVLNLFRNDTGTVQYSITVTNDSGTIQTYIEGQVCITNGGSVATEGLASNLILESPVGTVILTQALDVSPNPILGIGQTFCYPYRINIPSNKFVAGQSFKVTADTTILNHSGHIGEPFGPNESASGNLPTAQTNINQSINVNDTNGKSFAFTASSGPQTVTYPKDYSCNSDQGSHTNTATIVQTGQSASAAVVVNCYDLIVTKTVKPSFTRYYSWSITKKAVDSNGVAITSLTLGINESYTVQYVIDVYPTYTDSDFMVTGTITVNNPNPTRSANVLISDLILPDGINSTVTPASVSVPPQSSVTVNYSAALPNNSSRSDQATALLSNIPSGTTPFSSDAIPFDFSNAEIKTVDSCINVIDSNAGPLNSSPICGTSAQLTYRRTFGPYTSCTPGILLFPNTATFTTTDTQTFGSATWQISVTVPCSGCSLTIGYWKTHAGFGPQPDVVTPLLPVLLGTSGGALTVTVDSTAKAVSILNFGGSNGVIDAANGINRLYAQLLAAKLNIKSGADSSAIGSTIASADAFLATHNSLSWATLSRANRNLVNSLQATLESYNTGVIGPGHCSEQSSTVALAAVAFASDETEETDDTDPCGECMSAPECMNEPDYVAPQCFEQVYYPPKKTCCYSCNYYRNMWLRRH
ncbi:MAG TPA: hypothetical protein VHO94_00395 [Oscillospiraceae bacterium]|nr:hypothetical protein [Oscillospiraceae bacterium]